MAEESFVAVGIDITNDISQIAFFTEDMDEPQMLGDNKLFSKDDFGVKSAIGEYDTVKLFSIFAEKAVRFALSQIGREQIDVVTFSMPDTGRECVESIRKHFVECGLGSIKLAFITHAESSVYYVLNQKKELRVNDVAFFDFSKEKLVYRKLHMARPDRRAIIEVSEKDYTSCCDYIRKSDELFKVLVTELFDRQQISTVYLIGEGFENTEWARESLNYICNRRRVFKGMNLYALGACYKSMDGYDKYAYDAYSILCKGRCIYETCVEVVFKEERNEAILLSAGELWYDAGSSIEGILYNTDKINIVVRTVMGDVIKSEEISISDFPYRQERMTRVKIDAFLQSENEVQITVSDLGFGDFAVNSGLQVVTNIQY